jgi:D-3-phosphoglycerate dehydrogenase
MRLLAISDAYIPAKVMHEGLQSLEALGVELDVRPWEHATLVELQAANLAIEQRGPGAVELPAEVARDINGFDMLVVQFAPVSAAFIEAATSLKVIGVLRGGTENIDMLCATERGIAVLNTPGRNARAVAECTLGLMLSEVRNLARAHASLRQGAWRREFPNSAAIPELNEKTVGLIGYGAVARLVAHYVAAMGSKVVTYDPYQTGDFAPARPIDLNSLLEQADVVSLHARLTDETYHLVGRAELARMKPTAILVNTARSGLVDEQALIEALRERRIMGAALDVFDHEPLDADHPLVQLDNVTLTPHVAGSTADAFRGSPKLLAAHLRRMFEGHVDVPLVNDVALRIESLNRWGGPLG